MGRQTLSLPVAGAIAGSLMLLAVSRFEAGSSDARQGTYQSVCGTVTYPGGLPAPGVDVSSFWSQGLPYRSSVTDERGEFVFGTDRDPGPIALLVKDRSRAFGGLLVSGGLEEGDPSHHIELEPLVSVSGSLECDSFEGSIAWANVIVREWKTGCRVAAYKATSGSYRFELPGGRYRFDIHGMGVRSARKVVSVPRGVGQLSVGPVRMMPTKLTTLSGRSPPGLPAHGLGVGKGVRLDRLKGKFVLLEFWGYW